MSVQASAWAWGQNVSPGAKLVLLALADVADGYGECYPGQKRLARMTGMGERTVRRHLADMEAAGVLESVERRRRDGSRTSDLYQLRMAAAQAANLADSADVVTGQNRQSNRPKSTESPAKLAGHELSVEPSVQPPEQDLKPLSAAPTSTKLDSGVQRMFLDAWNEHCGPLPKALGPNSRRANAVKALTQEYGLAGARELFIQAVKHVASDPFWAEKNLNIDNLLVRGRVAEKAEKQAAGPGKPRATRNGAVAPDDFSARGSDYYQPMTGSEWLSGKRAS